MISWEWLSEWPQWPGNTASRGRNKPVPPPQLGMKPKLSNVSVQSHCLLPSSLASVLSWHITQKSPWFLVGMQKNKQKGMMQVHEEINSQLRKRSSVNCVCVCVWGGSVKWPVLPPPLTECCSCKIFDHCVNLEIMLFTGNKNVFSCGVAQP